MRALLPPHLSLLTRARADRDVLHATTVSLPAPNLQLIAKGGEGSDEEVCKLAGIVLALVVQVRSRATELCEGS